MSGIRTLKEVSDRIWLISFMKYDLGFFDHETGRVTSVENPFDAKVLPMLLLQHSIPLDRLASNAANGGHVIRTLASLGIATCKIVTLHQLLASQRRLQFSSGFLRLVALIRQHHLLQEPSVTWIALDVDKAESFCAYARSSQRSASSTSPRKAKASAISNARRSACS